MRRVIRGDLHRILRKWGFYLWVGFMLFFLIYDTVDGPDNVEEALDTFVNELQILFPVMVPIPVYLGVYADEIKAGTMQAAIGRGISRNRIVLAKFLDAGFLCALLYGGAYLWIRFRHAILGLHLSALQQETAVVTTVCYCLLCVGFLSFAAIFAYLTWNPAVGLVILVILSTMSKLGLEWFQQKSKLPFYTMSFQGRIESTSFCILADEAWLPKLLGALAWITLAVGISMLIMSRKELEL